MFQTRDLRDVTDDELRVELQWRREARLRYQLAHREMMDALNRADFSAAAEAARFRHHLEVFMGPLL